MALLSELPVERQVVVRGEPQAGYPVVPNTVSQLGEREALWLGPDEWLVLGGAEADFPEAAATVDVSANRVVLALSGDDAEGVLARGCSLDIAAVLSPGRCAQTLVARVEVLIVRDAPDAFRLFVRPSFAAHLRAWLADAIALGAP